MTNEERYKRVFPSNRVTNDSIRDSIPTDWSSKESKKHSGTFSQSNPYYTQLQKASSKADEDALFELSVKWEAEQAGYLQERADKYADLQEQRAYDDPLAVVARKRSAGINPDLEGSSAGVGAGSSAVASMPSLETPTDNTSHFSNQLDRHSMLVGTLGAVGTVVSSLSGLGSTVINGISTLKQLPIVLKAGQLSNELAEELMPFQIKQAEKNVDLTGKNISLTDERIRGARIANESSELGLFNQSLGVLNSLSSYITPDTPEADVPNILRSLGVAEDKVPIYQSGIKQWHSNPAYKANYEKSIAERNKAEAFNEVFSIDIMKGNIELQQQVETAELLTKYHQQDFQSKVAKYLNTDTSAQQVGNLTISQTSLASQQVGYDSKQLEYQRSLLNQDMKAFTNQVDYLAHGVKTSEATIASIRKKATDNNRPLTASETALIQVEQEKILSYTTLGSRYLGDAKNYVINTVQNAFYSEQVLNDEGFIEPIWFTPNYQSFINQNLNFTSVVNGSVSSEDIASSFGNALFDVGVKLATKGKSGGMTINNYVP